MEIVVCAKAPIGGAAARWTLEPMDELNGRILATQLLITGLIARVANQSPDPVSFLTDFRDEILAVTAQVRIAGPIESENMRRSARASIDELFSLMKAPSEA